MTRQVAYRDMINFSELHRFFNDSFKSKVRAVFIVFSVLHVREILRYCGY